MKRTWQLVLLLVQPNRVYQGHLSGVGVGVVPIVPRQLEGLHSGTQLEMNVNSLCRYRDSDSCLYPVTRSICTLVGRLVRLSVCHGLLKGGKLHLHAPIRALLVFDLSCLLQLCRLAVTAVVLDDVGEVHLDAVLLQASQAHALLVHRVLQQQQVNTSAPKELIKLITIITDVQTYGLGRADIYRRTDRQSNLQGSLRMPK